METAVANFHKLERRLRLSGSLTTRTALHVGSGGAGPHDAGDMPVLRDALGFPFIPGSSLKGALRSTAEALVRGAAAEAQGIWACDPLIGDPNLPGAACGSHKANERDKVDPQNHCPICRLFGSRIVSSHVRFSDAFMAGAGDRPPVELRDGVAIDRDLGVVRGPMKYDFEVVAPGVIFDLEIFVENPEDWLMGILVVGFDQLADGFTAVGGFTSRGLGRVDIQWNEMTEVTARDLLEGNRPAVFSGGLEIERRFETWRQALGKVARGEEEH